MAIGYIRSLFCLLVCIDTFDFLLDFNLQVLHYILPLFTPDYVILGFFWVKFALNFEIVFQLMLVLSKLASKLTVDLL